MPRKRIKGRAKLPSITNRLDIQLSKANRRLRNLEKQGNIGKYASRNYIASIQHSKKFSYSRSRSRQIIKQIEKDMSVSEGRYWLKEIEKFNKSPTSTNLGIEAAKQRTLETISRITDKEVDDEDVESLYNLLGKRDFDYFADKIGTSEVIVLLSEAEETNGIDRFVQLLEQRMTISDENTRKKVNRLYSKYINGGLKLLRDRTK